MSLLVRHTSKRNVTAINSIDTLCTALSISQAELDSVLSTPDEYRYTPSTAIKNDGSLRKVYNPKPLIRMVQRRINRRIFNTYNNRGRDKKSSPIIWASYIFGSIPNQFNNLELENKDYISCAAVHCGAKSLLKIDVKNFFDNIHDIYIRSIFSNFFHFSDEVSEALTNICCYQGHLVQGALTSSYLACLCLYDVEGNIVERLARKNLKYTRLIDDITISSQISNYDFSYAKSIVVEMLHQKDLPVNNEKTKASYTSTEPLMVHGLRIAFKEPRLPSDEVRRIRASVRNIEHLASETNYRTTHPYRKDFNRCMGRVNKLQRVNHKQYESLATRLLRILPLPSKKDIERISEQIERLENEYNNNLHGSYWYWRRFNKVHERITILKRTFKSEAKTYRDRLSKITHTYIQ
ncbi:reverse transcriptase family protein [Pantoea ananatis]